MQGTKELLESCGVKEDEKARRRINASDAVANITAEEIQRDGVTIERLGNIGVPVFRYQTQITIHGVLPDIGNGRVDHYKSLVKNENGSLGVRYAAIDAAKKRLLETILHTVKTGWHVNITSTEADVAKNCNSKEECRAALNSIPQDVFVGCKYGIADPWGSGTYYAVLSVGAIEQVKFWDFVKALGGPVESEWLTVKAAKDAERAEKDRLYEIERVKERAEQAVKQNNLEEELKVALAVMTNKKLNSIPSIPCKVIYVGIQYDANYNKCIRNEEYSFKKGGFGRVLVTRTGQTSNKSKVADMASWNKRCEKGQIFAA